MIFTTNKPLAAWGGIPHDEDLAQAIVDRVLERSRLLSGTYRELGRDAQSYPECGRVNPRPLMRPMGSSACGSLLKGAERWGVAVRITMICCPFQTSYGYYADSLRQAIQRRSGSTVEWLASDCGCGDPMATGRVFQSRDCRYFEMPQVTQFRSQHASRRWLRLKVRSFLYYLRARRYTSMSRKAEVVHFQQTLNAYGSDVVFHWLGQPSGAARIVTVHELDARQTEFPERNTRYNRAQGIIVHCDDMKQRLVRLGVQPEKLHVVLHGTDIPSTRHQGLRDGLIYYGGHHLMSGKGIRTLFGAMSLLGQRLGTRAPRLKIHGHWGEGTPQEATQLAIQLGVADRLVWLNQISVDEMARQYRASLICALPWSSSFAGLPAAVAAANGLPVVATRRAGIPDHLADCGVWIDEDDAEQLARQVEELLGTPRLWQEVSARSRKRAEACLSWDVVAQETLSLYERSLEHKVASPGS